MDDSTDSAKDLFITQSSFRVDANTQEAEEAVNFFQGFDYDPAAPERVEYFDFSNDDTTGYTVRTESQSQEAKKKEQDISSLPQEPAVSLETQSDEASKVTIRFML